MGLGPEPQEIIRALVPKLPAGFSVCELGDQLYATKPKRNRGKRMWEREPAEGFYRALGCGRYVSIDANGRGTFTADLNADLPLRFWADNPPFDLVTNAGTTEHIFDQARCWRTIHDLTAPGGHIFVEQPCEGYPDHGLYNLHPTFFRDLAVANRYEFLRFEMPETTRGRLVRAIMRRADAGRFVVPTQGRYRGKLKA